MRNLGSIPNPTNPDVRLTLVSRDGASTFVHCKDDIISMTPIEWQMPFMGGLGLPSNYNVDLSLPLESIKQRLAAYNQATATLRVDVSGVPFFPHVGRVRAIKRDGDDPNRISLLMVDRLLDDDPMLPVETIVDSFPGTHPQEQGSDIGYPLYYGRHHRNFYHTAVDCDISQLLGPRNVSSANHVNSVFFNTAVRAGTLIRSEAREITTWHKPRWRPLHPHTETVWTTEKFDDVNDENNILMNKTWAQENGSTNAVSGANAFELMDEGALQARFWGFSETHRNLGPSAVVSRDLHIRQLDHGYMKSGVSHGLVGPFENQSFPVLQPRIPQAFGRILRFKLSAQWQNISQINLHRILTFVFSGAGGLSDNLGDITSAVYSVDLDVSSFVAMQHAFKPGNIFVLQHVIVTSAAPTDNVTVTMSVELQAQLESAGYTRHSIFSPVVNSADIAIFANPIGILDHVFSGHTGTSFVQEQSSAAQADVSSYELQCFFADRRPLTEIIDEFGRICAVNMWIGDSGQVNYRSYQESGTATVDRTMTTCDFISGAFKLLESPLGSSLHEQELAREMTVEYGYHFQRGVYERSERAFPGNNSLCDSAEAAGIKQALAVRTQYITDPDVASLYLGNLVRKHSQGNEFAEFRGGPDLFDLELADVLRVEHPMIVGSEATYQVIRARMDVMQGTVAITAAKLLSLNK